MNLYLRRNESRYIYRFEDEPGKRDILGFEKWFQDYLKKILGGVENISSLTTNPYYYSLIALKKYIEEQYTNVKLVRGWQHRLERFFFYANHQNKSYPMHGKREFQRSHEKFLISTNQVTTQNAYIRYGNKVELTDKVRKEIASKTKVDMILVLLKNQRINTKVKKNIRSLLNYRSIFYRDIYENLLFKNREAMRRLPNRGVQKKIKAIQDYMNTLENIVYHYVRLHGDNGNENVSVPPFRVPDNIYYHHLMGKTFTRAELCKRINDEYYGRFGMRLFQIKKGDKVVKTKEFPKNQPGAKYSFLVALENMRCFLKDKGFIL